jgi:murein L,D-transpeptidase YcbB/YkuD
MKTYIHRTSILFLLLFTSFAAAATTTSETDGTATEYEYEYVEFGAETEDTSAAVDANTSGATNPTRSQTTSAAPTANTNSSGTEATAAPQATPVPPETDTGATVAIGLSAPTDPFQEAIKRVLPDNHSSTARLADGTNIYRKDIILNLYSENGYRPLWTPISVMSLANALSVIERDGLNLQDYYFDQINAFLNNPSLTAQSTEEAATVDILLTEAFLRALYNLDYGKVDPELLDADHNYAQERKDKPQVSQYLSWIRQGRIDAAFDATRPKSAKYQHLKSALAHYLQIKANGGWPSIPSGDALKLGKEDERIGLIRSRLFAEGYLATPTGPNTFDAQVELGIKRFQERHNLKADGVVGPSTLGVMNITVDRRINQIRANLDRERWYFPRDVSEYLLVDVADFKVYWMKGQNIYWQSLVQVGKSSTTTPIFRDLIEHIDFNPTWSVPASIKRLSILPSLQVDSSYLDKKGYDLIDDHGNKVDPHSIDWDNTSEIPYTVRQPPGRGNALGKVKFMFPNKHSVFLHDTNQRNYFAKTKRTTSHGCIRLKNPFDFAEMLLQNKSGWDRARIDNLLASNRTTTVKLDKPLPILIQYSTVTAGNDQVIFREDIYHRDAKVIAALDKPFKLHLPDLPRSTQVALRSGVLSASRNSARYLGPRAEVIGVPDEEGVTQTESAPVVNSAGMMYFDRTF